MRVRLWKNVFVLIGIFFSTVFCWTIIFPLIGVPLWIHGHRKASRKLRALEFGSPTSGRILGVMMDYSTTINNKHPWKIDYEYDTHNGVRQGVAESWDSVNGRRKPGEHLWIVHMPEDPTVHAIWPPIL